MSKVVGLTPDEIRLRDSLIEKFRLGPLEVLEAEELIRILEKEKKQAIQLGDIAFLFGIAMLLGVLIDYVSNKKSFWRKLFK
ncbi:MAG: hypothetical protein ACRD5J_18715 [Nitrososphaeraceae archaeon]